MLGFGPVSGYSGFSFSHHGPRGRAASHTRSHITSAQGLERRGPAHPAGQSWHRWSVSPGIKGNVKNPEVSQGSSRSTPGPGQTGSTGHIPPRKAQAADLMQKSLTQLCLSCSWGSKMPRKPSQHHLGPHFPKELFLSAATAEEHPPVPSTAPALTASPGHARYHQPHPALPSWAGGKPQPCQGSPTAEPQNQSRN